MNSSARACFAYRYCYLVPLPVEVEMPIDDQTQIAFLYPGILRDLLRMQVQEHGPEFLDHFYDRSKLRAGDDNPYPLDKAWAQLKNDIEMVRRDPALDNPQALFSKK
jgi:hypothetical protein